MLSFVLVSTFVSSALAASLQDIEHVVIFMQENRAFDHYFGKLNGVRGFNDRFTAPLPSGLNSFYQPTDQSNLEEYQLPWPIDYAETSAMCMDAPEMGYEVDIRMWNNGHFDSWNTGRQPGTGMSYWTREGLPYYFNLYDHFAVGDQYFQSTFTATNPNRMFLFAGSNGPSMGEPPVLDNAEPRPGYNWTTVAEILQENDISWRVYQGIDNFDDNAFAWFSSFQESRPGDELFDRGMARQPDPIGAFEKDMASGTLPQVSWIIAPTDMSEHAAHHPAAGEAFTSKILDKLKAHPEVYEKTAFILNYDEGGQFFDHAWTPTPPMNETDGISTAGVEGEINYDVHTEVPAPMGLGFRVPLLVISPWSRGNIVVSEVFDHTSVIQFLEERFGFECPTISAWRRAITGNLLSAFDFESPPDYSWPDLPDTSGYIPDARENCDLPYPTRPAEQTYPVQETGTRVSRALPYEFLVSDTVDLVQGTFTLDLANKGAAGAPFQLYDVLHPAVKKYAVESQKSISDIMAVDSEGGYDFTLLGPNGFARMFMGNNTTACAYTSLSAKLSYEPTTGSVTITTSNDDSADCSVTIQDHAYGSVDAASYIVAAGGSLESKVPVGEQGNWYDLSVSVFVDSADETATCFHRRFAGRMETGMDTISDPAMASGVKEVSAHRESHPELPWRFRSLPKTKGRSMRSAGHKDALWEFKADNL